MENEKLSSASNARAISADSPDNKKQSGYTTMSVPPITLPKGGGAIQSIDEKFAVNAANGTAACSIPFPFSPSRNEFMPSMTLSYNSGSGNGVFGLGWSAGPPAITRKTEKKLPQYNDADESDIFIFSGAEDLVPAYKKDPSGNWVKDVVIAGDQTITRYKPRIEGSFARIEKITGPDGDVYWQTTSGTNVVSIFGKSPQARIADPGDATKIFKWLLEFSYDDKGNCFQVSYKQEDMANVPMVLYEKSRLNPAAACSNTYLKSIRYCNKQHFNSAAIDFQNWDNFLNGLEYLLELVLDYGEHDQTNPQPADDSGWLCRQDAFSDCRAGFEIRTYRLCRRVLMFHHFPELGTQPCLVRALHMEYDTGGAFTFLKAVIQKGYIRHADGLYSEKAMPPLEFTYQPLVWDASVQSLPANQLVNLPAGIDDVNYRWMDLYKEGLPGILTEQAGAWYYASNAGNGQFNGMQLIACKPSVNGIAAGMLQLQELEANGRQFLVHYDGQGFYELDDDSQWRPFKNFAHIPNIDWRDPNLKFIDLNGDGMADLLVAEDEVFTWYAAKGKRGFDYHGLTVKAFDEEKGPNIIFADDTEFIALADMNGDGLTDILRIRNGEVVYWPNLGYGKFGAMISMQHAPVFDHPDHFNIQFLKLADIDGSGTTDILYFGKDLCGIYLNQSGNSFSTIRSLPFSKMDAFASVQLVDLTGNGTACIVWSSPLPQHTGQQLRYLDLMGGKKPHVMTGFKNNMGKEVLMRYKPSTFFYLEDKKAGTPWITQLPFPVQCVNEVTIIDHVRKSRFTNQYTYHHGYYDMAEREFRGFGRVNQTDTEDFEQYKKMALPGGGIQLIDEGFHQPPVLTKTWFHTGAFLNKEKIFSQFAHEYYHNPNIEEYQLQEPPMPDDVTIEEQREMLRACKGLPLRVEVYSPDGSEQQAHPYTTASNSCLINLQQPRLNNQFAVFTVQQSESLTYVYERNPADPRIAHSMTIEVDDYGNVLKAADISYGRKTNDAALTSAEQIVQSKTYVVFNHTRVSNNIDEANSYHLPVLYETGSFELTGLAPATGNYFSIADIKNGFEQAAVVPYEALPGQGMLQKRLIEQVRSVFLTNDLGATLPLGTIESLAMPFQRYKLALTPGLCNHIYGNKVSDALLLTEGRYVHFDDDNYWIPSGTVTYDADHFYQATEVIDPFGYKTEISYDNDYCFFVQQTTDALGNQSKVAGFNFRTLSPYLLLDINDNRSGVRTDELGMVTATFIMGKAHENKGDFMDTSAVEAAEDDVPGSLITYDLFHYLNTGKPDFVKTTTRETHHFDVLPAGEPVRWQTGYAYIDGDGEAIMHKVQAEPGIALHENADGTVTEVDTTPDLRWIGNGRTILNNKGKPVKQYEPYFSTTFAFEDAKELVERGVTSILYYDSAERVIKTDMPDGTFTRVEFDAWMQRVFDQNDTVLESQWYRDRVIVPVPALASPEEVATAHKAAAHANTPAVMYFDALGNSFLSIADNAVAGKYKTTTDTDIEGNLRSVTDARGNTVMQYQVDMLGAALYQNSMDAGERWIVNNVMGKPLRHWDSRQHLFRHEYDQLHRPLKSFVTTGNNTEINFERTNYGEGIANDKELNLRGKPQVMFDAAGMVTHLAIDYKGNNLQSSRQLCSEYKNDIDWNVDQALEEAVYTTSTSFDALNRPRRLTIADQSIITPSFNEAGLLNKVEVQIKGVPDKTTFVHDIDYDAKRQRQHIVYGNNTATSFQYDPKTFRIIKILTTGTNGSDTLQQLQYTYDPVGNITHVADQAQQSLFFTNQAVEPSAGFTYDAIYRLVNATGREHVGQNQPPTAGDASRIQLAMPGDSAAMRNYIQQYEYDAAGNILQLVHASGAGSFTRMYAYAAASNRLESQTIGNTTENFTYDEHGNMLSLLHVQGLTWSRNDTLQQVDLGGGGIAWYVYDANGQRIRKVIERQGGLKEERIYLGGFEQYRKKNGAGELLQQTETLHVMDSTRRIAMVETTTVEEGLPVSRQLIRYQYSNNLQSATLELDEQANIISYEEYHPYGSTAYQAVDASIRATAKRYRYTGMERDEESGLAYHGARYYLPWLGRWLSTDPTGIEDGLNVYCYVQCNPVRASDPTGTQSHSDDDPPDKAAPVKKAPPPKKDNNDTADKKPTPKASSDKDKSVLDGKGPGLAAAGARGTSDAVHRMRYEKMVKTNSKAAVEVIKALRVSDKKGGPIKAWDTAKAVSDSRIETRADTRTKLTPQGRAISQIVDKSETFKFYADKYSTAPGTKVGNGIPPNPQTRYVYDLAEDIAKAAGRSRGGVTAALLKSGRYLGPAALGVGGVLSVMEIADAPEGQKVRVAFEVSGGFVGSLAGASVGGAAALAGATIILTFTPVGWTALIISGAGALIGSYIGGELGRDIGSVIYNGGYYIMRGLNMGHMTLDEIEGITPDEAWIRESRQRRGVPEA